MIKSDNGNDSKITVGAMCLQPKEVSAGRQNLLSSIWGMGKKGTARTMPNGDPPSLMLWGVEEDGGGRRLSGRHNRIYT